MGTGGGCCSFPPLLQSTVAVVRVVKTLAEADSASDLLVLEACGLTLADFEKTTYRIGSSGATLQHFGWPPAGLGQGFRLDRLLGPGRIHCLGPTHTVSQVQPQLSLVGVRVGTDSL